MRAALEPHQNIQKVLDDRNVLHCFSALRNVKDWVGRYVLLDGRSLSLQFSIEGLG